MFLNEGLLWVKQTQDLVLDAWESWTLRLKTIKSWWLVSTSFSLSKLSLSLSLLIDLITRADIPVNREEMACEEAELGPDCFQQKMEAQQQLHEQVKCQVWWLPNKNVHVSSLSILYVFKCAWCSNWRC